MNKKQNIATKIAASAFAFDFASVDNKHENVMVVKHPQTGDPTTAQVTLAGPEHPKHKALTMASQRAMRKKFAASGRLVPTDPEEDYEDALDKAVACTLGWKEIKRDGVELECTETNVRELYQSAPWLLKQVSAYIANDENFIVSAERS